MALASQQIRTQEVGRGNKGNYQSPRNKKKKQRLAIGIIAAVVVLGGGYAAVTQFGGKSGANNNQSNQANNTPKDTEPTAPPVPAPSNVNVPKPVEEPPKQEPDVLTMGKAPPRVETPPTTPNVPGTQPVVDPLVKRDPLTPNPSGSTPTGVTPGDANASTPASAPAPAPAPLPAADDMPQDAAQAIERARRAMSENKLVEARGLLNNVLANPRVKESEKEGIRTWAGEINQTLIFSPTVAANDPLTESYKVVSGDVLEKIARNRGLAVDWRLLARVNRMKNPNSLRLGQSLKLVRGPFHAVVHKGSFRLDLYAGTPIPPGSAGTPRADGSEEGWVFVRSFQVGLGENNGTPLGTFVVKKSSKLINPHWVNPRTGEKFDANDPLNPIGEHWLGLTGVDDRTKTITGYGLHGTIQPESIGKEMSMGCVRMGSEDIGLVWELLVDEVSTVRIVQ